MLNRILVILCICLNACIAVDVAAQQAPGRTGDLNKNGLVDFFDFALFAENWLEEIGRGKIAITINHSKVTGDLSDFPAMITDTEFPADFWDNVADDGRDIWFELADGTVLKREITTLDKDGKIFEAYVTIPALSGSIDTVIYLNYGDWTVDKSISGNVWDDNYKLVYHMRSLKNCRDTVK